MTDVGVHAWSRCDTVYECIQAVRLWQIKSVFTAAEIISKSEKDAWSRQIHSVTCTRSTQLPRDVINATEQEATANRKWNHCGKVCCPLGSVSTCVCASRACSCIVLFMDVCVCDERKSAGKQWESLIAVYKAARAVSPTGMRLRRIDL